MKKWTFLFLLFYSSLLVAQVNNQSRFVSDTRFYYVWNEQKQDYDLRETEYENSIIEIREIGTKGNGYIIVTLNDNGVVRLYHGSIIDYSIGDNKESIWAMRSKTKRGKLTHDRINNTFTLSFESDGKRYMKVFVFNVIPNNQEDVE